MFNESAHRNEHRRGTLIDMRQHVYACANEMSLRRIWFTSNQNTCQQYFIRKRF